jgi:hypothetical protein
MTYVWTDNPDDPCAYCVVWIESDDPDDVWQDKAVPVLPDGPVERVYRNTHDACDAAVAAYVTEARA